MTKKAHRRSLGRRRLGRRLAMERLEDRQLLAVAGTGDFIPPGSGAHQLNLNAPTVDDGALVNDSTIAVSRGATQASVRISGSISNSSGVPSTHALAFTVNVVGGSITGQVDATVPAGGRTASFSNLRLEGLPLGTTQLNFRVDRQGGPAGVPVSFVSSRSLTVVDETVADQVGPRLTEFTLTSTDDRFANSSLPVAISTSPSSLSIDFEDEVFSQSSNQVTLSLVETVSSDDGQCIIFDNVNNQCTRVMQSFGVGAGAPNFRGQWMPTFEFAPGQHEVFIRATDSQQNTSDTSSIFFSVIDVGEATKEAPGTPVFSETIFIGATVPPQALLDQLLLGSNQIAVDQAIPIGASINLLNEAQPAAVINSFESGIAGVTIITLDRDLAIAAGEKVGWLRPWQMSFDKSTQTVWFTMEDGHHLGQFDPATRSVDIYDVSMGGTAFDPHGVFFDFNTHLTPRVWFVYRNEVEGGVTGDDAPADSDVDGAVRISYFDITQQRLFTFDFSELAGVFEIDGHTPTSSGGGTGAGSGTGAGTGGGTAAASTSDGDASLLTLGHAVFVDQTGSVWVTAEGSGTLIELDFDNPPGGAGTIDGLRGRATAHVIPFSFGPAAPAVGEFHLHGVQTVVDRRDGTRYTWIVNGNEKGGESLQRVALLLPGATDRWFEFEIPKVLGTSASHLLFTALDDNETPGVPEDDKLIFTDTGFGFTTSGDGVVASLDVGVVVRAIQEGRDVTSLRPTVEVTQIPKLAGANENATAAAPIQSFMDRGGTTFIVDAQSGVARFKLSQVSTAVVQASVKAAMRRPQHARIELTEAETTMTPVAVRSDSIDGDDFARSGDRSGVPGIDQYEVASLALRRGNGEGPFRGALNAANTIYGSLAQSDHLSTTIFAESARRQMSAVVSPLPTPVGALTQARMAFQVIRDGSVILTARGDATLADRQVNLLRELNDAGRLDRPAGAYTIAGEAAAATDPDGSVHLMGRSSESGVVQYTFTPPGDGWDHDAIFDMQNWSANVRTAGLVNVVLAEDTVPAGSLGFSATTAEGHWLAIPIDPSEAVVDLTEQSAKDSSGVISEDLVQQNRVYSAVGLTSYGDRLFGYGSNQTGSVVEYEIDRAGAVSARIIDPTGGDDSRRREHRMMRNVRALTIGDVRHLFATDGVARLVHWTIDAGGNVRQENVSQLTVDVEESFGYFPFQQPFAGRVYTYVAPLVEADGTIRVYGTNGGDLVEFTLSPGGEWRVANLTNDTLSTFASEHVGRVPANAVFGGPAAYIDDRGGRHILQINAEGEVIEYFTYGDGLFAGDPTNADRFNSQNVNFFSRASVESLVFDTSPVPAVGVTTPPAPAAETAVSEPTDGVTTGAVSVPTPAAPIVPPNVPVAPPQIPVAPLSVAVATTNGSEQSAPAIRRPEDVTGDGIVSPRDALLIINQLVREVGGEAVQSANSTSETAFDLDVNDDDRVSPLDALLVINYLSRSSNRSEGEPIAAATLLQAADDSRDRWELAIGELLVEQDAVGPW